ncbi:hypothetical protein GY45DRAFT_1370556 [Cubamyces sp. BRFM 1775]|nr:hypothetical protein GY45DRAFT_1370556 [Cubamyces sp. BRFM 1775]
MSSTITIPSGPTATGGVSALSPSVLHLMAELTPELNKPQVHSTFESAFQKADPSHEIRRLKSDVKDLTTLFTRIYIQCKKNDHDAEDLGVRNGPNPLQPLAPQWAVLRKQFDDLLDQSRKNASDASAVLKQHTNLFTKEILQSCDCDIIKIEVENLLEMINDRADKAKIIEGSFTELSDEVRTFEFKIQDAQKATQSTTKVVYHELETTRGNVRALRDRLTKVTKEMTEMGVACIACLSAGALSTGAFLLNLSPQAATTAVVSVIGAVPLCAGVVKDWWETRGLRKRIQKDEATLSELEKKHDRLLGLEESLMHSQESLSSLADKIDAISSVWHTIKADMTQLHSELSTVVLGKVTPLFMQKLTITHEVYRKLVDGLGEYAHGTAVLAGGEKCPGVCKLCESDNDME